MPTTLPLRAAAPPRWPDGTFHLVAASLVVSGGLTIAALAPRALSAVDEPAGSGVAGCILSVAATPCELLGP